jgi:hypothetical protein
LSPRYLEKKIKRYLPRYLERRCLYQECIVPFRQGTFKAPVQQHWNCKSLLWFFFFLPLSHLVLLERGTLQRTHRCRCREVLLYSKAVIVSPQKKALALMKLCRLIVEESPWPLAPRAQYAHLGTVRPNNCGRSVVG